MTKRKLPIDPNELTELAEQVAMLSLDDLEQLAREKGFANASSLERSLSKNGYRRPRYPHRAYLVAPSEATLYNNPPLITTNVLMLSDPHFCFHNADFINHCFDLADTWHIPTLLWAGDYLDFKAFGRFMPWPEDIFENEIKAFGQAQEAAEQIFKRQIAVKGNHEERLDRFISRYLSANRISRLFDKVASMEFSDYRYAAYQPEDIAHDQRWLLGHPDRYSMVAGKRASETALINYCNVACGHNHYLGMVRCPNGIHWGIDTGHCTDVLRHDYKGLHMPDRPIWATGSLMIMNSHPYLLTPDVDWQALSRTYRL